MHINMRRLVTVVVDCPTTGKKSPIYLCMRCSAGREEVRNKV